MKKLLSTAFLILTLNSAMAACPDLTGEYVRCTSTSSASIFKITLLNIQFRNYDWSTLKKPNYTIIQISEAESGDVSVSADGVRREEVVTDSEIGEYTLSTTATCSKNSLRIKNTISLMDMTEQTVYSKPTPKTLKVENYLENEIVNTTTCDLF